MFESNTWIAFIDGSALPNPGRMAIGGVIHAPDGSAKHFSIPLHRLGCNNEAEALAAIHVLRWLLERRITDDVLLHTDSSILVEQLMLTEPKRIARLAHVYGEARALFQRLPNARAKWIPRHRNVVADALARSSFTSVSGAANNDAAADVQMNHEGAR